MKNYDPSCSFCKLAHGELPGKLVEHLLDKVSIFDLEAATKSQIVFEDELITIVKLILGKKDEKTPKIAMSQREDPSRQGLMVILKEHRPRFNEGEIRHSRQVLKTLGCKRRINWKRKIEIKHASCTARLN